MLKDSDFKEKPMPKNFLIKGPDEASFPHLDELAKIAYSGNRPGYAWCESKRGEAEVIAPNYDDQDAPTVGSSGTVDAVKLLSPTRQEQIDRVPDDQPVGVVVWARVTLKAPPEHTTQLRTTPKTYWDYSLRLNDMLVSAEHLVRQLGMVSSPENAMKVIQALESHAKHINELVDSIRKIEDAAGGSTTSIT